MIEILLLGVLVGLWHAIDIDHIAAIITFIAVDNSSRLRSVVYGLIWGLGHATMLMIVVLAVMTLKLQIGDEFAWLMEFLVAVMLIALALDLFRRLAKVEVHTHEHQHSTETTHSHVHVHMENVDHAPEHHAHGHFKGYFGRALLVGLMHGSAGSAALILLMLQTISSKALGIVYVVMFGLGSTLGMTLLTVIISAQLHRSHLRSAKWTRALRSCAAILSLSVGLFLMIKAGAGAGLFMMN